MGKQFTVADGYLFAGTQLGAMDGRRYQAMAPASSLDRVGSRPSVSVVQAAEAA